MQASLNIHRGVQQGIPDADTDAGLGRLMADHGEPEFPHGSMHGSQVSNVDFIEGDASRSSRRPDERLSRTTTVHPSASAESTT